MTIFNLSKEAADLSTIDIGRETETVPTNGLKMLFPFGAHDVGVRGHREWNYWETGIIWDQRGFDGMRT